MYHDCLSLCLFEGLIKYFSIYDFDLSTHDHFLNF